MWNAHAAHTTGCVKRDYLTDSLGDQDELYDLESDSWELYNAVGEPENRGVLGELREKLADWSLLTEDARLVPLPDPDRYDIADR